MGEMSDKWELAMTKLWRNSEEKKFCTFHSYMNMSLFKSFYKSNKPELYVSYVYYMLKLW